MCATYRLEILRQQREEALEQARVLLARRVSETARAAEAVATASARLCEARTHFKERRSAAAAIAGRVRGRDLTAEQAYLDRLAAIVAAREEAVAEASAALERARAAEAAARAAAAEAQQALEVLERDKARFVAAERAAAARREEADLEDLATARAARRRSDEAGDGP